MLTNAEKKLVVEQQQKRMELQKYTNELNLKMAIACNDKGGAEKTEKILVNLNASLEVINEELKVLEG